MEKLGLNINYKPDEDKALNAWRYQNKKWREPKVFYQFLIICKLCNIEINKNFLKQSMNSLISGIVTLERAFYLAKISELINFHFSYINKLPEPQIANDLWMFVYLANKGIIK